MNLERRPLLKKMVDREQRAKAEEEKVKAAKEGLAAFEASKSAARARGEGERTEAGRISAKREAEDRKTKLREELGA